MEVPSMKTQALLCVFAAFAPLSTNCSAQVFADFESFSDGQSGVMFAAPLRSPSTSGYLNTTPNVSAITATFPTGDSSTRVLGTEFSFKTGASPEWLRLATSGTATFPVTTLVNPTIDFNQNLRFDIYSDRPIKVALGVRETGTSAAIGANGGGSGSIEWVGASGEIGTGTSATPIPTRTILANAWTKLTFDIDNEPTVGFSGNGVIDKGATGKGVLEHLAIVPLDGPGTYKVYLDNFEVTSVPEPAAYAGIFGLLALGGAFLYRRRCANS